MHNWVMARWHRINTGGVAVLGVLILGAAVFVVHGLWPSSGDDPRTGGAVTAPPVVDPADPEHFDAETQRLYRISPSGGSRAGYSIDETLGAVSRTTVGSTTVMAGEVVIDTADLAASRVGEIVVNVETLASSSVLRDRRIRHDYLRSSHWPFVRFEPAAIDWHDASTFADDTVYDVTVTGDLTVKDTTRTETFAGTVSVTDHTLTAEMAATVLASDYDVGPINIARLVRTSNEITLTFEVVAQRVDVGAASAGDLRRGIPAAPAAAGEFAAVVQPILEQRCASCHNAGGPGFSTVALDTAADAAAISQDIAFVTGIGYMPPWMPSGLSPAYVNDWSLTDTEKAAIRAWADAGGGLDVAPGTPLVATNQAIATIEEDQELAPRDGPYTSYARDDGWPLKTDDYRCQVHEVSDPEGDGTWVKALQFRPDQTSVVHHAVIYRAPAAATDEIAAKIAAEDQAEARLGLPDEPGWTCFGLSGLNTAGVYAMQIWIRGKDPQPTPTGTGSIWRPAT